MVKKKKTDDMMGIWFKASLNLHSNVINNTLPRLLYVHQDTSSVLVAMMVNTNTGRC